MSSINIIAIKGNHLERSSEIFATFNYIDLNNDKRFDSWDKSATYLYDHYFAFTKRSIALRGLWADNGWTIICDPEMVDEINDNTIKTLSLKLNADVLTFLIQTTAGSFGFSKFSGDEKRRFLSNDGQVEENVGTPLTEESGLNINEKVFSDDIVKLAAKFGIDLKVKKTKTTFIVKELGYDDEMKKQLKEFKQQAKPQTPRANKPWWKF